MAFPRLNALGYWLFPFGGLLLFQLVTGGAPSVGWFGYAPLSEHTFAGRGHGFLYSWPAGQRRGERVGSHQPRPPRCIAYQGFEKHVALIRQGATIGDAKLWYDRPKKQFYLLVSLTIDLPEPTCEHFTEVIGVDVGIRYLAVTSAETGKAGFHPGKRIRHKANHYARLQTRNTCSKRHSWRETSLETHRATRETVEAASHIIAKQIITEHPHTLIGLENLTDIRERTKRKKRKRKKHGKGTEKVSPKARKANRVYSQWSFAELQALGPRKTGTGRRRSRPPPESRRGRAAGEAKPARVRLRRQFDGELFRRGSQRLESGIYRRRLFRRLGGMQSRRDCVMAPSARILPVRFGNLLRCAGWSV